MIFDMTMICTIMPQSRRPPRIISPHQAYRAASRCSSEDSTTIPITILNKDNDIRYDNDMHHNTTHPTKKTISPPPHLACSAAEQSAKSRPVLLGRLDAVLPAIPFELLLLLILLQQSCSNPQRLRSSFPQLPFFKFSKLPRLLSNTSSPFILLHSYSSW